MVVAAADPEALASFWEEALGYERITPTVVAGPNVAAPIVFLKAPKTPTIVVPVHFDVNVPDREREVERLLGLGARVVVTTTHAVGEISETFTVLRDPEGNGFCVQAPGGRDEPYLGNVTFAAADPGALADFWAAALGYERAPLDPEFAQKLLDGGLDPTELDTYVAVVHPERIRPRLLFQRRQKTPAPEPPLHLDLEADDVDAEVDRLESLGARRAAASHDGQEGLEDPEGNPFCLGRA
jgi:predicted enzyme related to lactoylglutathione lyase/catechol 2,3-dioxygenase-like lactoylglutathione lyase family enzyme